MFFFFQLLVCDGLLLACAAEPVAAGQSDDMVVRVEANGRFTYRGRIFEKWHPVVIASEVTGENLMGTISGIGAVEVRVRI